MGKTKFNWQIWTGLGLSIFAFISYPTILVEWPATRDIPWVNMLLFGLAAVLLFLGIRRSLAGNGHWLLRAGSVTLAVLGAASLALFITLFFVAGTLLPASKGAPQLGQSAPDFTLIDSKGNAVSLAELRTRPIDSAAGPIVPRGVLLIFYRGYW